MFQKIFLFIVSFLIFIFSLPILLVLIFIAWLRGRRIQRLWREWEKQTHPRRQKALNENIIDVEYEEIT